MTLAELIQKAAENGVSLNAVITIDSGGRINYPISGVHFHEPGVCPGNTVDEEIELEYAKPGQGGRRSP